MSVRWLTTLGLLAVTNLASAFPWDDDSRYVSLGPRNGYCEAPWIDTADPLRHGDGALAFRFDRTGVLITPPAYIVQGLPNDFYTRRIGPLTRGRATTRDVEAIFGRGHTRANRAYGFMWYYALPVYNPFEDRGGGCR